MKKILLLAIAALTLASCRDFLDLRPQNKIVPKSAEDYVTLLNNMIDEVEQGRADFVIDDLSGIVENESIADDLDANVFLGQTNLRVYIGSNINNRSDYYGSVYTRIMTCNMILDGLSDDNSELAVKAKAAAYAIRGICHYNVLRQFCEPVTDGVYPDQGIVCVDQFNIEARLTRSSYASSVEFIEDDFERALALNMTDRKYMFTVDVVNAFMARLYFWTQQWDKALDKAEDLLAVYPLLEGNAYLEMFTSRLPVGNVIIKSTHFANSGALLTETNSMREMRKRPVNRTLVKAFDQPDKDIRYSLMMDSKRLLLKRPFGGVRAAEMALIVAECHYHMGNENLALAAINDLRRHRISGYTDLTMSTLPDVDPDNIIRVDARGNALTPLISLILNERRKELFMEGDRLFERKRNGRPETWVAYNGFAYLNETFMYTFPLPYTDVKITPGLVQNPGYTRTTN